MSLRGSNDDFGAYKHYKHGNDESPSHATGRYKLTVQAKSGNKYFVSHATMTLYDADGDKVRSYDMFSGGKGRGALAGIMEGGSDATYSVNAGSGLWTGRKGAFEYKDGEPGYSVVLGNSRIASKEGRSAFRIHSAKGDKTHGCLGFTNDNDAHHFLRQLQCLPKNELPTRLDILAPAWGVDRNGTGIQTAHNKREEAYTEPHHSGGFFAALFGSHDDQAKPTGKHKHNHHESNEHLGSLHAPKTPHHKPKSEPNFVRSPRMSGG